MDPGCPVVTYALSQTSLIAESVNRCEISSESQSVIKALISNAVHLKIEYKHFIDFVEKIKKMWQLTRSHLLCAKFQKPQTVL